MLNGFSCVGEEFGIPIFRSEFFWELLSDLPDASQDAGEFALVDDSFLLARVPMRHDLWTRLGEAGYDVWDQAPSSMPEQSVTGVSWASVQNFIESLPQAFRLPFEAEWESSMNLPCLKYMSGTLWQWCEDAWSADEPYLRVLRGGSFRAPEDQRSYAGIHSHADDVGFRLAFSVGDS